MSERRGPRRARGLWRVVGWVVVGVCVGPGQAGSGVAAPAPVATRVAVLPVEPAAPRPLDRQDVGQLVAAALTGQGEQVVGDELGQAVTRVTAGVRPLTEASFFADARGKAREGWRAHLLGDHVRAMALLGEAEVILRAGLAWPGVPDLLADVLLQRGAAELLAGNTGAAQETLTRARVLDSEREVGPEEFHPDVVARVAELDARLAAGPRGALAVRVTPAGAEVWIDGVPMADGGAAGLLPGEHVVWATAQGHLPAAVAVTVVAGEPVPVALTLVADPRARALAGGLRALRAGGDPAEASRAAEAALSVLGADQVVLAAVTWRKGELVVVGQRCAGVPLVCGEVVEAPAARRAELPRAAATLVAMLTTGARALELTRRRVLIEPEPPSPLAPIGGGGPEQPGVTPPGNGRPWYRQRWLWWTAGGVVVLGASAAILAASSDDESIKPVLSVDVDNSFAR